MHRLLGVLLLLPTAALAASSASVTVMDSGRELGTSYDVVLVVPSDREAQAREDLAAARERCRALEQVFSAWAPDSELSRLDARAGDERVPVSEELRRVLDAALHVAAVTEGAFDPTWRPLEALWDEAEQRGTPPTGEELAAALSALGWQHLSVTDEGVRYEREGMSLGLAGVAKGWIIDAVFLQLRGAGYEDLIVNIGGDLRTAGRDADGAPWAFGVADPRRPERRVLELELQDTAVATSGNYLRKRQVGERVVGHILDPRTGHPPPFDGSVTALTRDAATADALATALFVMGPEAGLAFARSYEGLDAVYCTAEGVVTTMEAAP